MKSMLLLFSLLSSVTVFAVESSEKIEVGSEVIRDLNYGLGCVGTVKAVAEKGYVVKFESYTAKDGHVANNCQTRGEEFVSAEQIQLAAPTPSAHTDGIFGFWSDEFKIGDSVLTKRSYKFCPGKIENIVNDYAKVSVDYTQSGCGLMKNYFIHFEDIVRVKRI